MFNMLDLILYGASIVLTPATEQNKTSAQSVQAMSSYKSYFLSDATLKKTAWGKISSNNK